MFFPTECGKKSASCARLKIYDVQRKGDKLWTIMKCPYYWRERNKLGELQDLCVSEFSCSLVMPVERRIKPVIMSIYSSYFISY